MQGFFSSGHAVDLVLLVIAAEYAFLSLRRPRDSGKGVDRVLTLAPGVCILLALRVALTGGAWPLVAAALALSFPFHIADVMRRKL